MEHVKVWDDGPVRVVALNRPEKGNAITKGMAEAVQVAMRDFAASDQRAMVLTAPDLWRAVPTVGVATNKPIIAAIEGWCVGGAIVLAMMCDLAVCGRSAKFYYPEAKLGITGGMIAGLVSRIPHKIAMEIALLCRTVEAERAERVGLVNEVVPDGEALAKAIAWGKELAEMAPLVLGEIKRMVTEEIIPRGPSEQMAIHMQRMGAIRASEDFKEGVAAFKEKRPPRFRGR